VGEDGENTMGNLLPGDEEAEPQAILIRQEMKELLDKLMASLDARQQQILRLRFGMDGEECASLEEIGKQLGISKERVRQIEQNAIEKMQKMGTGMGLEDFLG
jgi:RNA polymerase primary sigma factor